MPTDEQQIRRLIEDWAEAVRAKDMAGILRHHAPDIVMYDVAPPLQFVGLKDYEEAWHLFYEAAPDPPAFEIREMHVAAAGDVAFGHGRMHAVVKGREGKLLNLEFRLTLGLRKHDAQWTVVHEHHSLPLTP